MKHYDDLSGRKFNQLTVLNKTDDIVYSNNSHHAAYQCRCDCGKIVTVRADAILSGHTRSCGCSRRVALLGKNLHDLSGQKFGRWTVLHRVESLSEPNGKKATMWHCKCDCGTERDIRAGTLISGNSKSCGCLKMDTLLTGRDITGQRFGRWTVIRRANAKVIGKKNPRKQLMWHCKCDCGVEKDVSEQSLIQGKSISCGCYRKEQVNKSVAYQDLTGLKFEHWTVLQRMDDRFYPCGGRVQMWKVRCDCGNEAILNVNALKNGESSSCGCQSPRSSLEQYVKDYLDANGFDYTPQKTYDTLLGLGGKQLSYDYIVRHNHKDLCLIECQGEQHYRSVKWFGGENRFVVQQEHDLRKAKFANELHLPLIVIPYWVSPYEKVAEMLSEKLSEFIDEE